MGGTTVVPSDNEDRFWVEDDMDQFPEMVAAAGKMTLQLKTFNSSLPVYRKLRRGCFMCRQLVYHHTIHHVLLR